MDIFETIMLIILIIGFGFLIYLILQDPIHMFKTLLRGLKPDYRWDFKIMLFPIWGPIWLIDKVFGLKLYINELEEASNPEKIVFKEFDKYLLIKTMDLTNVESVLSSFQKEYDPQDFRYSINDSKIKVAKSGKMIIIKVEQYIDFASYNSLIYYTKNSGFSTKGVLINKINRSKSYYVFCDPNFLSKLVGKTYANKKMYIDLDPDNESNEIIYLNSNLEFIKNFDFNQFEYESNSTQYKELCIKPST